MTEKTASPAMFLARVGKALSGVGRQIGKGGVRNVGAPAAKGLGWARGGAAVGRLPGATHTVTRVLKNVGMHKVRNRMVRRAVGTGVAGAGGSAVSDKMQGKKVNVSKAIGYGFAGAALGAVAGTTSGKRTIRRAFSPQKTQTLTAGQAAKSLVTPAGMRANIKNMGVAEKGFLGLTAYDTAKQMTDPNMKGQRGRSVGAGIGETAALLGTSRWRGMRRLMGRTGIRGASGGGGGAMIRSVGVYMGGTTLGGHVGSRFDKGSKIPKEAPYG